MKNIKYKLQKYDGIWSIPLAFTLFFFLGILLVWLFGESTGTYDPGIFQSLFLAITISIGIVNFAMLGVSFTFREIYKYIYGKRNTKGEIINLSKEDWSKLSPIQKILIALFIAVFFILFILVIFLQLI